MARARAFTGQPFERQWAAKPTRRARCLAAYIFEGAWRFDLEWVCDAIWSFFAAGKRCVQRAGGQERARSRRPAADIALNFGGGAISRPAMLGRPPGTGFEMLDPEGVGGRVRILERC